ncbi:hypothetical protein FB567DRAFT_91762 [Paraphoma chrysanthemicola]|uniref:Monocarboxylate transporter 4 n=1 Tax=Paraphoma chrysanthemicola TaxID=798071 RepID=A0A8K0R4I4_9PLEO|nr:hypothetical protein FB567DRAFT_91762 [Paraphoma chrysanthemicola]
MDSGSYWIQAGNAEASSSSLPTDPFGFNEPFQDGSFDHLSAALSTAQDENFEHESYMAARPFSEDLSNNSTAVSSPLTPGTPLARPKLGSRFSREVIRTLKTWLAAHQNHPYPKEDDMIALQQRTGLNHAQLTNWFANARRRGKAQAPRPSLPQAHDSSASPIDIIQRPGTPAVQQDSRIKNPLQRWVDSPPEHEPADVGAIARAMASDPGGVSHQSAVEGFNYANSDPWRSPYVSASSAGTSHSSDFSNRQSSGSQSSLRLRRPARRKRVSRRRRVDTDLRHEVHDPYQCTFCTESFKTKHDWQRHEKSLHLPLEQWVCALHGPRAPKANTSELCCVFCSSVAPDDTHVESHHYTSCQDRDLEERTFHRKDHLVQHLRLVHDAKFESWAMRDWMVPMPNIKSLCGFCGREMSTWVERTDHLADHFKGGATMAEWKGDWGFSAEIVAQVENAVPPYLIEYERNTLVPTRGSDPPWGSPPNAYELLKAEIEFFMQNYIDAHGKLPTNDAIQLEACRVVFAAEARPERDGREMPQANNDSWLRDLIMCAPNLAKTARFGPVRTSFESRHSQLKINGKDHPFEQCPLENQLRAFVVEQQMLGAPVSDSLLQTQMCIIVRGMELSSMTPSDTFVNWMVKGIYSGSEWLSSFKQRAGCYEPIDALGCASGTAATAAWPTSNHLLTEGLQAHEPALTVSELPLAQVPANVLGELEPDATPGNQGFNMYTPPGGVLPDDFNFFRIFESDIKRWVAATMSPKNPNCHVPSDEEIQHQARWIMYGGDDAWNQTPADFAEWLLRFKRDVGIIQ